MRTPIRAVAALVATAAAAALALPAAASAHVTVVPKSAPAGAYTVLDVRVPNERDDAGTTKVDLKLPPGFVSASFEPVPGWDVRVIRERLSTPIETENGPISEQVSRIVWSGGVIPPGAFQDFPISVQIPDRAGSELTFKALQTYAGGEVVRWIGAPDAEAPAPQIAITDATDAEGDGAGAGTPAAPQPEATPPAAARRPATTRRRRSRSSCRRTTAPPRASPTPASPPGSSGCCSAAPRCC